MTEMHAPIDVDELGKVGVSSEEIDWDHLEDFWDVVSALDTLAGDLRATIERARAAAGSRAQHEQLFRLRAQLRAMTAKAHRFELLADEYERDLTGLHRRATTSTAHSLLTVGSE